MSGFSPESPPSKPSVNLRLRFARSPLLELLCRYLLAIVFLLTAAQKLLHLTDFIDLLVSHDRLPTPLARTFGLFIPWLELTCGYCLLLNVARREAAVLVGILLVVFAGYILSLPPGVDCGCSPFPKKLPAFESRGWLVLRNLCLLACAVRVSWRPARGSTDTTAAGKMSVDHPPREES